MKVLILMFAILCIIGCQGGNITCKDGKLESLNCGSGTMCREADYINAAKACK